MSHSFDTHALRQLVEDAEYLIACTSDHERRVADLMRRLEGDRKDTVSVPVKADQQSTRHRLNAGRRDAQLSQQPDLIATVRQLCVGAEEQRSAALKILGRIVGELAPQCQEQSVATRVLVVDDSPDSCDMAAMVLEHEGFHVITAANGLEGILAAYLANPAVVLMDINMPVLSGIEATRLLKACTATQDLLVVAYTAKPDFYEGPMTRLFIDVLSKPSNPDAIVASVRRCVVQGGDRPA